MKKKKTSAKKIGKTLQKAHTGFFKRIDRLYDALNHLYYEGKISSSKNIEVIEETIDYFKNDVFPHVMVEEKIIFDFLAVHVPRLDPTLRFLRADHKEFKANLRAFEILFNKFKKERKVAARDSFKERMRDKGIYIIFLMRNHIQLENESICTVIDKELHAEEQELFLEMVKQRGDKKLKEELAHLI